MRKFSVLQNLVPLAQLPLRAKIYSAPMVFILINVSKQSQVLEMSPFIISNGRFCLLKQSHRLTVWVIRVSSAN